jgi:hypothetical protein
MQNDALRIDEASPLEDGAWFHVREAVPSNDEPSLARAGATVGFFGVPFVAPRRALRPIDAGPPRAHGGRHGK